MKNLGTLIDAIIKWAEEQEWGEGKPGPTPAKRGAQPKAAPRINPCQKHDVSDSRCASCELEWSEAFALSTFEQIEELTKPDEWLPLGWEKTRLKNIAAAVQSYRKAVGERGKQNHA